MGIRHTNFDNAADDRHCLVSHLLDSEPPHFDEPCESGRRACKKASVARFERNAVIGDQSSEGKQFRFSGGNERQGEPRFAGT